MTENNGQKGNLDELLRERARIDENIADSYQREITILYTDIKGYTRYCETRGDLAGRALVQKQNDLIFPCIKKHGGHVVKEIGDAIMASFQLPVDAVEAAVEAQRALYEYNQKKDASERILVRMGINTGIGLVDKSDINGDVVNLAQRLEALAQAGQVLVSTSVYQAVRNSDDIILRYHGNQTVKGKAESLDVYRVVWQEELEPELSAGPALVRGGEVVEERVLALEFTRAGGRIKLTASERVIGQEKALKHYEEKDIDEARLDTLCADTIGLLNRAGKGGKVSGKIFSQLKEAGQQLYDSLMTPRAKELIASTTSKNLIINIDDMLAQVPWELLFDGAGFLCLRFNMGRIVATSQKSGSLRQRRLGRPLRMLILSDPRGDLPASYAEGQAIRDEMDGMSADVVANLRSFPVDPGYAKAKMRNYDIVHYAGHADYNTEDPSESGWLLDGGKVTARDLVEMTGSQPMPALVFSNACHSGQTEQWNIKEGYGNEIFGLANAFLLSGTQHYIGAFWEILDEPSAVFATLFYAELMNGSSIGASMRQAREGMIRKYGQETIIWGSYMLYGDPTYIYKREAQTVLQPVAAAEASTQQPVPAMAAGQSRANPATVTFGLQAEARGGASKYLAVAAAVAVIACGAYYGLKGRSTEAPVALVATSTAPGTPVATTGADTARQSANPAPTGSGGRSGQSAAYARQDASSGQASAALPTPQPASPRMDHAKSERIRKLAHELALKYKENGGSASQPADTGEPRPMTVAFINFEGKGAGAGSGEDEALMFGVQQKLVAGGKLKVVDRDLLESVIGELSLSSSELADKKVALRLGKLMSARYIATGSIYRSGNQYIINIRLIDTETTSVVAALSDSGKGSMDINKVSATIAAGISDKLSGS